MVKETFNAKETFEAGYEMGKKALPGQIYCLNGCLLYTSDAADEL